MTKEKVKNFLMAKPSYKKWGNERIASKCNCSVNVAKMAKQEVKMQKTR